MVVARRQEPVKKTKKNSSVQRKRPSVEPMSNTPKNVKKKKRRYRRRSRSQLKRRLEDEALIPCGCGDLRLGVRSVLMKGQK